MKHFIHKLTYSFDEDKNYVPELAFKLLDYFTIRNNVLVHFFRILHEWIDFQHLKQEKYITVQNLKRNDEFYLFFNTLSNNQALYDALNSKCFYYPSEIKYIFLKSELTLNFENIEFKDMVKNGDANLIVELYEGVLLLTFEEQFFKNAKHILSSWESTFHNLNFRKTQKQIKAR